MARDFVVDRIVVSDVIDSLVGLDEVAMLEEIDLVNDMDQDWIDDRSGTGSGVRTRSGTDS